MATQIWKCSTFEGTGDGACRESSDIQLAVGPKLHVVAELLERFEGVFAAPQRTRTRRLRSIALIYQ